MMGVKMLLLDKDGKPVYFCAICGKEFTGPIQCVTSETRQNGRGRIAWERDGICPECAAKPPKPSATPQKL